MELSYTVVSRCLEWHNQENDIIHNIEVLEIL